MHRNGFVHRAGLLVFLVAFVMIGAVWARGPEDPSEVTPTPTPLIEPAIIGGSPVAAGEFPWLVALVAATNPTSSGQFCGGTLVTPNWVLTAAHCFINPETGQQDTFAAGVAIVAGRTNLDSAIGGQVIQVAEIVMHETYNNANSDNDIALLRLATPALTTDPNISTVTIMNPASEATLSPPGTQAIVSGWGATNPDGTAPSPILLKVNVPVISNQVCSQTSDITDNMVCAGGVAGQDSCRGDSGGPVFVPNGTDFVQIGLSSFGPDPCGQADDYGVYTRVSRYNDWITQRTGSITTPGQTQPTATATVGPAQPTATATATVDPAQPTATATATIGPVQPSPTATQVPPGSIFRKFLPIVQSNPVIIAPYPAPVEPLPVEPPLVEPLPDEPLPDEPLPDEPLPDEPLPVEPLPVEPLPDEPPLDEPPLDEPLP